MELKCRNVNAALADGIMYLRTSGITQTSRNGPVLVAPEPVLTVYRKPQERVLFSPRRDANPFFHLMEALWMLAGRNDLAWPLYFNSKFGAYSDDGVTVHGAYGDRWRVGMGFDQLIPIANELKNNPESRRCILQMWDATQEAGQYNDLYKAIGGGKDVPCNTHVYFLVQDGGTLDMTVCCRSNDIILGAYGANAVHMSILQEYVAARAGYAIGTYRQFSNNYHLYTRDFEAHSDGPDWALWQLAQDVETSNRYEDGIPPSRVINIDNVDEWDEELSNFFRLCDSNASGKLDWSKFTDQFFTQCALPMYAAWTERKEKRGTGLAALEPMQTAYRDWYAACKEWIERRELRNMKLVAPAGS